MIHVPFVPPDRICNFVDRDAKATVRLTRSEVEASLRKRLEGAGCTEIEFEHYDFRSWLERANEARDRAIAAHAAGTKVEFEPDVWRSMRDYVAELFSEKCAYCEVRITASAWLHVEHYRPKSSIDGVDGHGYYWLAYCIDNYLPACVRCNTYKGTRFPLLPGGRRARSPRDHLESELPALLNPARERTDASLCFDPIVHGGKYLAGGVRPLDERGEQTISILRLNREELFTRRREQLQAIRQAMGAALMRSPQAIAPLIEGIRAGTSECAAAQYAQVKADLEASCAIAYGTVAS